MEVQLVNLIFRQVGAGIGNQLIIHNNHPSKCNSFCRLIWFHKLHYHFFNTLSRGDSKNHLKSFPRLRIISLLLINSIEVKRYVLRRTAGGIV